MFGGKKLTIPAALWQKLEQAAELSGSSSVEELSLRAIEKEVDRILSQKARKELSASEVEDIAAKMKGLGYLE